MKNHFEPPPKDLLQVQCSKGFNLRLQRSDFYSVAAGLRQMMATTSAIDAVEHIAVTTSRANIGAWSSQTQIRQRSCGHRWTGHDRHGRHRRHCCRHRRRKSRTEKGRTGCEWLFEGIWELQHREVRGFWPWRSHQVLLSWTLDFISYTFWLKTTSKEQKSKKSVLQFTQYMYRLHINIHIHIYLMLLYAAGPYIQIQIRLFCGVLWLIWLICHVCSMLRTNAANHRKWSSSTAHKFANLQVTGIHLLHVLQMCAPPIELPSFSVCHP